MVTIAVCSERGDPQDPRTWSGTPASVADALRAHGVEVVPLGPLGGWRRWMLVKWSALTSRFGRRWNWDVEPVVLRFLGRCLLRELAGRPVDAVLTMGWHPILPRGAVDSVPVYYWGDAPMAERLDRSPFWSGISARTRRLAVPTERCALATLSGTLMSSQWGVESTVASGAALADEVHHVPFGANLEDPGPVERRPPLNEVRLLSVGVQWRRKGLDLAVLTADRLRARGLAVSLDIVGTLPPDDSWRRPWVTMHGFVDSSTSDGAKLLDRLYRDADVFVLLSQYDPSPIVLSEAHAYALPVVVTSVCGITERVADQGVLVAPDGAVDEFADAVEQVLISHQDMSRAARRIFDHQTNWASSTARLLEVLALGNEPG